jgi:hypothetical protein
MTAKLLTTYMNPHHIHGISQGSFQTLDNGNVLIGYGNTAAFTEYSYDGHVLCDTHFGPESRFGSSDVQSYRVYKYEWHATPLTNPDAVIIQHEDEARWSFYVSWNGATEIATWVLQGSDNNTMIDSNWRDLESRPKDEFEEEFALTPDSPRFLRAVAFNKNGQRLGIGGPLDLEEEKVGHFSFPSALPSSAANITNLFEYFNAVKEHGKNTIADAPKIWALPAMRLEEGDTWWLKMIMGFCAFSGLCVGFREGVLVWRKRRRRRRTGLRHLAQVEEIPMMA